MDFDIRLRERDEANLLIHGLPQYKIIEVYEDTICIRSNDATIRLKVVPEIFDDVMDILSNNIEAHTKKFIHIPDAIWIDSSADISKHVFPSVYDDSLDIQSSKFKLCPKYVEYPKNSELTVISNQLNILEKSIEHPVKNELTIVSYSVGASEKTFIDASEATDIRSNIFNASLRKNVEVELAEPLAINSTVAVLAGHYTLLYEIDDLLLADLDNYKLGEIDYVEK